MTLLSTLELCAIVAPPIVGLYAVARQRNNLRAKLATITDALLTANDRALRAEARLDLIHSQHVEAGRQSHRAEKAKCAQTTRALALSIGRPDLAERVSPPLEPGGLAAPASSPAREGSGSPAPLSRDLKGTARG